MLVYAEIIEYLKSPPDYARRLLELRRLLREVYPFPPTYAVQERYADLRRQMRASRLGLIGDVDTLISATAIERNLIVVTSDTDFERVSGLRPLIIPRSEFRR